MRVKEVPSVSSTPLGADQDSPNDVSLLSLWESAGREFILPRIRVRIRPAREDDLAGLHWAGGGETHALHRLRLAEQENGDSVFFMAEINGKPIGYALLRWDGRPTAPDYPDIQDMQVFEPLRGFGVGTALIDACETIARRRGFRRIGLAVNPVKNSGARALYERLGYRYSGAGPYLDTIVRPEYDPEGDDNLVFEMVKDLGHPSVS